MLNDLKQNNKYVGLKQSTRAIHDGTAVKAFIAYDSDPGIFDKFVGLCQSKDVPIEYVSSMKEIGEACKIDVGAAVAVIVKS